MGKDPVLIKCRLVFVRAVAKRATLINVRSARAHHTNRSAYPFQPGPPARSPNIACAFCASFVSLHVVRVRCTDMRSH